MFAYQFTLTALTALSILSYAPPLAAMTLVADSQRDFKLEQGYNGWYYGYDDGSGFQQSLQPAWGEFKSTGGFFNGQSSQAMVRRWTSDFNGKVQFELDFLGKNDSGVKTELIQEFLIDGHSLLTDRSNNLLNQNNYKAGIFDVQKGSTIDFKFAPANPNWAGWLDLDIEIEGEAVKSTRNPNPVLPPPPIGPELLNQSGLIFLTSSEDTAIHLALAVAGTVYEANPMTGVQKQSLSSFIANKNYQFKGISTNLGMKMATFIEQNLGSAYSFSSTHIMNPYEQKGYYGRFTTVGLIERAAEEAHFNGGQGFIPNYLEYIPMSGIGGYPLLPAISRLNLDFMHDLITKDSDSLRLGSSFSTQFKAAYPTSYFGFERNVDDWFYGHIEDSDFIVTDPQGRKMGYVSQLGFFNEIPDLVYSSQNFNFLANTSMALGLSTVERRSGILLTTAGYVAPNSFSEVEEVVSKYSLDGDATPNSNPTPNSLPTPNQKSVFQFAIERRLPGEYKIEKWNYHQRVTTPEPGAIASLIATAGFALKFLKRRTR